MTSMGTHLSVVERFARSANLERDIATAGSLAGYVLTSRAADVVTRIAATAVDGRAGGAWSITGPYGSGKSSVAVLLDAAFGPAGAVRDDALAAIEATHPDLVDLVQRVHERHGTVESGFNRAVTTARREPVTHTVLRALHSGVERRFGSVPSKKQFAAATQLKSAIAAVNSDDARHRGPSPTALVDVARCLADDAPLLVVIDELGKSLESTGDAEASDPYLLQQLAEAGQGGGAAIFVVTLQHLSFDDYLTDAADHRRKEWAKVRGRFEDVAYVESPAQTRALIATAFTRSAKAGREIDRWAQTQAAAMTAVGSVDLIDPDVLAGCYPLHPLTAAVLPELCTRFGQNERTLFSFLTGADPNGVVAWLRDTVWNAGDAPPTVGLDRVYDYFVAANAFSQSSRFVEIATRIRDTHGLDAQEVALAKAVAVLNLVSVSGSLRASSEILTLLEPDASAVLAALEAKDVVTYRTFADEYRVWHGSDLDLRRLLDDVKGHVSSEPLIELLRSTHQPDPVVAARHSAQTDTLRVFSRRYVEPTEIVTAPSAAAAVDGDVVLVVGDTEQPPPLAQQAHAKPVVAAVPRSIDALDAAVRAVATIVRAINTDAVQADWVARRELSEQLAAAERTMRDATSATFGASSCAWYLLGEQPRQLTAGRGSAALSEAADIAYPHTPYVGNETINRAELTSQGAKARRMLLEAMIEHGDEAGIGLQGHGPEVAIYRSLLHNSGIHRFDARNDTMTFTAPSTATLAPAWELIMGQLNRAKDARLPLDDVLAAVTSPPVGMKAGVAPVLVTAALLSASDEVAIYEHGTFRPTLTADVSERMVRNPSHFEIKHFANTSGARRQVVEQLAEALSVAPRFRKHRVANVLSIVGHAVSVVNRLDNYTRNTSQLSEPAQAVRNALMTAVEPDALLFEHLPAALGFRVVGPEAKTYGRSRDLAAQVAASLDELRTAADGLRGRLLDHLLDACAETERLAVVGQALALSDEVLDPKLRPFVLTLSNDSVDNDHDWVAAVATVVADKAPAEWTDTDEARYRHEVTAQAAGFKRLHALHAERRATGSGAFSATRVTVTTPEGAEGHRLVDLAAADRPVAEQVLAAAIAELEARLGSPHKARSALLALLGEHLLPVVTPMSDNEVIDISDQKAGHG